MDEMTARMRDKIRDCARRHEARLLSDAQYRQCVAAEKAIFTAHCAEVEELERQTGERHL